MRSLEAKYLHSFDGKRSLVSEGVNFWSRLTFLGLSSTSFSLGFFFVELKLTHVSSTTVVIRMVMFTNLWTGILVGYPLIIVKFVYRSNKGKNVSQFGNLISSSLSTDSWGSSKCKQQICADLNFRIPSCRTLKWWKPYAFSYTFFLNRSYLQQIDISSHIKVLIWCVWFSIKVQNSGILVCIFKPRMFKLKWIF